MSDTDPVAQNPKGQSFLARVLPAVGGILGVAAFVMTVTPVQIPWASSGADTPRLVTFDTAKYVNARRAAASDLLGNEGESRDAAISTLSRIDRGVRPQIESVADGAVVLVRQAAVLDGALPDITDQVLNGLGLSTDAPTIETSLDRRGDTSYSSSDLYEEARELVRRANKDAREKAASDSEADIEKLLP